MPAVGDVGLSDTCCDKHGVIPSSLQVAAACLMYCFDLSYDAHCVSARYHVGGSACHAAVQHTLL